MFANNWQRSDITLIRITSARRLVSIVALKLYYFPYQFDFLFSLLLLSNLFDSVDFPRRRVLIERRRNHSHTKKNNFSNLCVNEKAENELKRKWMHARAHHPYRTKITNTKTPEKKCWNFLFIFPTQKQQINFILCFCEERQKLESFVWELRSLL